MLLYLFSVIMFVPVTIVHLTYCIRSLQNQYHASRVYIEDHRFTFFLLTRTISQLSQFFLKKDLDCCGWHVNMASEINSGQGEIILFYYVDLVSTIWRCQYHYHHLQTTRLHDSVSATLKWRRICSLREELKIDHMPKQECLHSSTSNICVTNVDFDSHTTRQ